MKVGQGRDDEGHGRHKDWGRSSSSLVVTSQHDQHNIMHQEQLDLQRHAYGLRSCM